MEDIVRESACQDMHGYICVYICPLSLVKSVDLVDVNTKKVVFESGGSWTMLDLREIIVLSENDADIYVNTITGKHRTPNSIHSILNGYVKNKYIVRVDDKNDKSWIFGSKQEGLNLKYTYNGPSGASEDKNYLITIFGNTTDPMYLLL